jgi:hypothetical protein
LDFFDKGRLYDLEVASTSESVLEQIPYNNRVICKIIKEDEVYDFLLKPADNCPF